MTSIANNVGDCTAITFDLLGNIYINGNTGIRLITQSGTVSTLASSGGGGIATNMNGVVYFSTPGSIKKLSAGGAQTTLLDSVSGVTYPSIAVDSDGCVYALQFISYISSTILKLSPLGTVIATINDGPVNFQSRNILEIANNFDPTGSLLFTSYLSGYSSYMKILTRSGETKGFAASTYNNYFTVDVAGNFYTFMDLPTGVVLVKYPFGLLGGGFIPACDSTWHHVAATYSPTSSPSLSTFVDGALISTSTPTITLPSPSSSTLRVGWSGDSSTNSGSPFAGSLADLRIYSRTLSPSEVAALAQPSAASFPGSNLVPLSAPSPGGNTALFSCAAGTAGPISVSSRSGAGGAWAWVAAPACTPCAAGTWAPQGATACAPCPPGTYSLAGASTCSLCPAGTFGSSAGLTSTACSGTCASCAAGSTAPAATAASCAAGSFPGGAGGACTPCPAGTYSLAGAAACSLCSAGRYGGAAGLTSADCSGPCPGCPAGTANPPPASSLSCASGGARALPSTLGMRLWPAAHPQNQQHVDLIVAPADVCAAQAGQSCAARASVVMGGTTLFVVGKAADLHMEPAEDLTCAAVP